MSTIITYKLTSDNQDGQLERASKTACNFWNRFIKPANSIVIRVGLFQAFGSTIARAYKPYRDPSGVLYGGVEFNQSFLSGFSNAQAAATLIHEVGHTLGIGWDKWLGLFDQQTGLFLDEAIQSLPDLENMHVETDFGPGTVFSHWDETKHDKELMTGFKDNVEYVLPVTISIMRLLGHEVIEQLQTETLLSDLLPQLENVQFSSQELIDSIDRNYFERTEIWEEIYSGARRKLAIS